MALNNEQTQQLVNVLHANELRTIMQFRYRNANARTKDLYWCNRAYQEAIDMLTAKSIEPHPDEAGYRLQQKAAAVMKGCVFFSYNTLKNYRLRAEYMDETRMIVGEWNKSINLLYETKKDYEKKFKVRTIDNNLTEDDITYYIDMLELHAEAEAKKILNLYTDFGYQISSVHGAAIQLFNKSFEEILRKQPAPLNQAMNIFNDDYKHASLLRDSINQLNDQYTKLNDSIVDLKLQLDKILERLRSAGTALLIVTLGVMLWTIQQSKNSNLQIIKSILDTGAAIGGGWLGTMGGAEVGGAVGGPVGVFVGGLLGGFISSCVSGIAADSLFDALLAAFERPESAEPREKLFGKPILYELQLPNNVSLSQTFIEHLNGPY